MALPKSFTKVTTFSKWLALSLFIILPVFAFCYGIYFEKQNHIEIQNPFCKQWETVCSPDSSPETGCAPKQICVDGTPTIAPTDQPITDKILDEKITWAKDNLATKLHTDATSLHTLLAQAITWNDGSLGCPKKGFMYTQSLIEGYKIILSDGQKNYEYHAGKNGNPFLCEHK